MSELIAKAIVCGAVAVMLGTVIAFFLTPVFMLFRAQFYVPFTQKKLIEKAKQDGRVIKASLYKTRAEHKHSNKGGMHTTGRTIAFYQYPCKGETRTYRLTTAGTVKKTIELYYLKNPKKAVPANHIGIYEAPWIKSFFLLASIFTAVIFAVGMLFWERLM